MYSILKLWNDEAAFVATTDLILISSILIIGTIVGLTTFRDQVVQELGDVSASVSALNQSYSYASVVITFGGQTFSVAGSQFVDTTDDCDTGDPSGAPAMCISLTVGATHEG